MIDNGRIIAALVLTNFMQDPFKTELQNIALVISCTNPSGITFAGRLHFVHGYSGES